MPPGDRRSTISAWKEFNLLHFQLLFSILKSTVTCSWRTDTKHLSSQVTGTDKASSPNRLSDHQPLKEKPGGLNMQKGCKNKGRRKAAFPLRSLKGLAQSCCSPCHTLGRAGRSRLAPFHLLLLP